MSKESCQKRHPKVCKRLAIEGLCRCGAGSAYHHQEHQTLNSEINVKVENMETTLKEMLVTIGELETKIKVMES